MFTKVCRVMGDKTRDQNAGIRELRTVSPRTSASVLGRIHGDALHEEMTAMWVNCMKCVENRYATIPS